jgi:hypothetical protein
MNFLDAIDAHVPLPLLVVVALAVCVHVWGRARRAEVVGMTPARREAIVLARRASERARLSVVQEAASAEADYAPELGQREREDVAELVRGLREGIVDETLRARIKARRGGAAASRPDENDLAAA